jgi:cap1 methyltransferase
MSLSHSENTNQMKTEKPTSTMPAFLARLPRPLASRQFVQKQQPEPCAQDLPALVQKIEKEELPLAEIQEKIAAAPHALPPVVSVKKSHRGCAVVILRDNAIIDRCALQRVAVIDGVCVEMKRHSKKNKTAETGEEEAAGIFCAWGMKVERKVPVSEEGIEEFFNSLSGASVPQGLAATSPFQEGHISFPLASEGFAMLSFCVEQAEANKEQLLASSYCDRSTIEASWAAKDRLDALWNRPPPPMARSLITRVARSQMFPHSGEGGQDHENRAGDKLAQISEMIGLLDGIPEGAAFLDLCGGPGAWSQHLLDQTQLGLRGFGFTLASESGAAGDWQAQGKDDWYEDLYEHPNWSALWGLDGKGDLLKTGNLEHMVKSLAREHVLLVVADGGFSDDAIPPNCLELYFYRLFLAELLTAATCLSPGGKFVCKLYSTFSDSTAALLFLTTQLFDSVSIVKPISSKATGPERYLTATGFRDDAQTSTICAALARSHALGAGASPLSTPLFTPAVASESLQQDKTFCAGMRNMVTAMCERQTKALNATVDRHNVLEDIAMACAVCTDPWARGPPATDERHERHERKERHEGHERRERRERSGRSHGKKQWQ